MAQANIFAILGNKIIKNLKIFVEVQSWTTKLDNFLELFENARN